MAKKYTDTQIKLVHDLVKGASIPDTEGSMIQVEVSGKNRKNTSMKFKKDEFKTLIKVAKGTDFDGFKAFISSNELPPIKLKEKELEVLRGGSFTFLLEVIAAWFGMDADIENSDCRPDLHCFPDKN